MEELKELIFCATVPFLVTDYLPDFIKRVTAHKYLYYIGAILLTALSYKPLSCPVCLSIWIAIIITLTINQNFILYIGCAPICVEAIERHLKLFKLWVIIQTLNNTMTSCLCTTGHKASAETKERRYGNCLTCMNPRQATRWTEGVMYVLQEHWAESLKTTFS